MIKDAFKRNKFNNLIGSPQRAITGAFSPKVHGKKFNNDLIAHDPDRSVDQNRSVTMGLQKKFEHKPLTTFTESGTLNNSRNAGSEVSYIGAGTSVGKMLRPDRSGQKQPSKKNQSKIACMPSSTTNLADETEKKGKKQNSQKNASAYSPVK